MTKNDFDTDKKLGRLIKESLNNNIDDLDFYKDIKYIDHNKTYKKESRFRGLSLVASVAAILVISSMLAIYISNGSVSASMFKIEQTFVNLTGEKNSSINQYAKDDSIVLEIDNFNNIGKGMNFFPGLYVSDNVPIRFLFKSLTITKYTSDVYNAVFLYVDTDNQILTISQQSIPKEGLSISLVGVTDEIKTDQGTIYISENPFGDGGNSATYEKKDCYIDVAGKIDKDEILSILNQNNK